LDVRAAVRKKTDDDIFMKNSREEETLDSRRPTKALEISRENQAFEGALKFQNGAAGKQES
jgi:hypothetical protein